MEAARVPQQLLGELFVQKGLITPDELAEALAEQKESGKRIGQILVQKGFVSRPDLTTVLAEQLGVVLAKQEGFGAGLWSEIKRRHPRGRDDEGGEYAPSEPARPPETQELRLALIDELDGDGDTEPGEVESLRQQLAFASTRLDEERGAHDGTRRMLEEARGELGAVSQELADWRERAVRADDSDKAEQAAARLAELEATATELRAELDARDRELAAGAEVQTQLAAEAARLEEELKALRDEHSGSKDAIAALTAQVDELRASGAESQRLLDKERTDAAALDAAVAELRSELGQARKERSEFQAAVTALTEQLDAQRASGEELERKLTEALAEAAAFEATVGELREELSNREDVAALERELAAVREEMARVEQDTEKRTTKLNELQRLLEDEQARSAAAATELAQELSAAQDRAAGLEQRISEREPAFTREAAARAALEATLTELRAELASHQEKAKTSERKLGELRGGLAASEEARSREAAARVAAEAELAKLRSDARALSESLEEARGSHVAARREVGRLESRCAELEPLEALLAQANAHVAARTQSLAELTGELEAVRAELAERPEPPPVEEPAATHIVFLPSAKGYALAELPGPTPEPGAYEDVDEVRFLVSRIGPSPLPADQRRCAYLEVA